jgi:hypothetical protein
MTYLSCPIPGCDWVRGVDELLCRNHWRMVPKDLRDAVWREFRRQRGSQEHMAACRRAIESITQRGPQGQLAL